MSFSPVSRVQGPACTKVKVWDKEGATTPMTQEDGGSAGACPGISAPHLGENRGAGICKDGTRVARTTVVLGRRPVPHRGASPWFYQRSMFEHLREMCPNSTRPKTCWARGMLAFQLPWQKGSCFQSLASQGPSGQGWWPSRKPSHFPVSRLRGRHFPEN